LPAERLQAALGAPVSQGLGQAEGARVASYFLQDFSASLSDGRLFDLQLIDAPHLEHIEGAPFVVARLHLTPPPGAGADLFDIH